MRSPLTPIRAAVVVLVVLVAVTVGGAVVLSEESAAPLSAVAGDATERFGSLDGVAATQVQTVRLDGETTRTVRRIVARPGAGEYRAEVRNGASRHDLTVSNGSVMWVYDRDNESVWRTSLDGRNTTTGFLGGPWVERLLTAAVADSAEPTGISLLPSVSTPDTAGGSGSVLEEDSVASVRVRYAGTERLGDRRAYVVSFSGAGEARAGNFSGRLWVDTEWFVALRWESAYRTEGRAVETTIRLRNISFDPSLEGVSFEFDPPPEAEVNEGPDVDVSEYETRAALEADTAVPVPDPEVPAGYEFDRGLTALGEGRQSTTLVYTDGSATLRVTAVNETGYLGRDGRAVRIGNRTGRLDSFGGSRILRWQCESSRYSVAGTAADNETLVAVARSVGCGEP